jgi:heptaprenyl diphosphate synthase
MEHYRVPEQAHKYINHELVRRYTELPDFPHFRTRLLYAFLTRQENMPQRYSELYSLVTSLVQVGLDTHDLVDAAEPGVNQKLNRPNQLRVLAGDYLSSRFYQLLAQAGQVEWVKKLSQAICEVNRLKINFYMMVKHLRLTAEEYLQQLVHIRSALFLSFTQAMEQSYRKLWPEVLELFTRCELLMEELERTREPARFPQSWAYWYVLQEGNLEEQRFVREADPAHEPHKVNQLIHKYRIVSLLHGMLEKHLSQLYALISRFESDRLAEELRKLANALNPLVAKPIALEEI